MANRDDDDAGGATPSQLAIADTAAGVHSASREVLAPDSAVTPIRAVQVGDLLGRYELKAEIGEGGMATVYRASDTSLRRDVAIKVLFPHLAKRSEVAKRFAREARAAAGLDHPNILKVLDVGVASEDGSPPYIVMELVVGESLAEFATKHAPIPAEYGAAIVAQLSSAVATAHRSGIIHRDIKPANVMVTTSGKLLLTDFGVAQINSDESLVTKTGALLGTPAFMSPEQAAGDAITPASDVYSLAVTLYQLVTAHLPFAGNTAKVLAAIAAGAAQPADRKVPAVGSELAKIIAAAMLADVQKRTASAQEFAQQLEAFVSNANLGSTADLVAEVFSSPQVAHERIKQVVPTLVRRADTALRSKQLALGSGLVERALAIDPSNDHAKTLATRFVGSFSRRWLIAAVATLVAGAAIATIVFVTNSGSDPVVATALVDGMPMAADGTHALSDAAEAPQPTRVDATPAVDARKAIDARSKRVDAAEQTVALVDANMTPSNPVADAREPTDAARATEATITFVFDTWCELSIDGTSQGRWQRGKTYPVAQGTHQVACSQGPGLPTWSKTIAVTGESQTISAAILAPVTVTAAIGQPIKIGRQTLQDGASAQFKVGQYEITVVEGGTVRYQRWLTLTAREVCKLTWVAGAIECE